MAQEITGGTSAPKKTITEYIGDFFVANTNRDRRRMNDALMDIEKCLERDPDSEQTFGQFFADTFSGRSSYNLALTVSDYPVESVVRELLQNTFDCYYDTPNIKVAVHFRENGNISFAYNECGFSLEQFIYYLSLGRGNGDLTREGRFGVGAKSVFMNVLHLSMRSNNFSFQIANDHGVLSVEDISLNRPHFTGTEIVIKVDNMHYNAIRENFLTLTEKKGPYINLVELCFAFNRKKVMDIRRNPSEAEDRTINLAIMTNGKLDIVYTVQKYKYEQENIDAIRFLVNKRSVADFVCYARDDLVFLLPFAVAGNCKESLMSVLLAKYNYFSTFELTGLLRSSAKDQAASGKVVSAFFVSVPNHCVTAYRSGLRHDSEQEIAAKVERAILAFIREYRRFFVLELIPAAEDAAVSHSGGNPENTLHICYLRPTSYIFEFVKNYLRQNKQLANIADRYQEYISLKFPGEDAPTPFELLRETAYAGTAANVSSLEAENGTAWQRHAIGAIETMERCFADLPTKTLAAGYSVNGEWSFLYKFYRGGQTFVVESAGNPKLDDYGLMKRFQSAAGRLLSGILENPQKISNEDELEKVFELFDTLYDNNYALSMKYFQFYFTHGDDSHVLEAPQMHITNLVRAIGILRSHENRFVNFQTFAETTKMFVNIYTESRNIVDCLREIEAHGGQVTLARDLNGNFRFSVYGTQIPIPSRIKNSDLIQIFGDIRILIKHGFLTGRPFDLPYQKTRYAYDYKAIAEALSHGCEDPGSAAIAAEAAMSRVYVSGQKVDRIALVNAQGVIIDFVDEASEISPELRAQVDKYIYLRDDITKAEFAGFLERAATGVNLGRVARFITHARVTNPVLPDHMPLIAKPVPNITRGEFEFLRSVIRKIEPLKQTRPYAGYFARDINFKLFGYGETCPICGRDDCFLVECAVKNFQLPVMLGEHEKFFNFSLFLCAADFAASDGWVIDEVTAGGMSLPAWLEEIALAKEIHPEFLYCTLHYREQVSKDTDFSNQNARVYLRRRTRDFLLTPLMAAKWADEN